MVPNLKSVDFSPGDRGPFFTFRDLDIFEFSKILKFEFFDAWIVPLRIRIRNSIPR